MMLMIELSRIFSEKNVSFSAVYPGVVSTNIKRHMGVDKSIIGNFISNPLLWFLTKTPDRGAQTPLFLALDDDVHAESNGKLYSKMKPIDVDSIANNSNQSKRLLAIAKYWTGQVHSKDEVIDLYSSRKVSEKQ